ncbi:MAG: OsmC family protein [Pseudomonadota bacterium]
MSDVGQFILELEHLENYEFRVRFDWDKAGDLLMDEPPPLGGAEGPNAARLLAAAVGNCLSASLLFCLAKNDVPAGAVSSTVTCTLVRNEKKRLRIGGLDVRLRLAEALAESVRLARCRELFEDFCVVTASLRQGIPVEVTLEDAGGHDV